MFQKLRTPDEPASPVAYRQILLTVPTNADIERFLWGAVSALCFHTAWIEEGTMSARDAAFYIKDILKSRMEFNMIGVIVPVIRETLHSSMLLCDGSVYNKSDFPQLWESLPSAMKDATTLTLPDLRNLFLVGAGLDYERGDTGGLAEVTLTVDEIPSHAHEYTQPTFGIDMESVGIPDPTGVGNPPIPTLTSFEGGGEAHENRPPYYALTYAIIAKVQP